MSSTECSDKNKILFNCTLLCGYCLVCMFIHIYFFERSTYKHKDIILKDSMVFSYSILFLVSVKK